MSDLLSISSRWTIPYQFYEKFNKITILRNNRVPNAVIFRKTFRLYLTQINKIQHMYMHMILMNETDIARSSSNIKDQKWGSPTKPVGD